MRPWSAHVDPGAGVQVHSFHVVAAMLSFHLLHGCREPVRFQSAFCHGYGYTTLLYFTTLLYQLVYYTIAITKYYPVLYLYLYQYYITTT